MTTKPSERLKEIEEHFHHPGKDTKVGWLISRVKRLTEALEKIQNCYDDIGAHDKIAKEALRES